MTKNQKIAIGCGAIGCLGLIILMIAAGAGYYFYSQGQWNSNSNSNSDFEFNSNSNNNSSISASDESNIDDSSEESTPEPTPSDTTEDTSSTMSDDGKHRLFQAAATCGEAELMGRVNRKVGITSGTEADAEKFTRDHIAWAVKNTEFITQQINTRDKACAYVREHIDD